MSESNRQTGDVAWIECEENPGIHILCDRAPRVDWVGYDAYAGSTECTHPETSGTGKSATPVLILREGDDAGIKGLCEEIRLRSGAYVRFEEMKQIIATMIANQHKPKPPAEPLDPAVRAIDRDEEVWARVGKKWVSENYTPADWTMLVAQRGPVKIVTAQV